MSCAVEVEVNLITKLPLFLPQSKHLWSPTHTYVRTYIHKNTFADMAQFAGMYIYIYIQMS